MNRGPAILLIALCVMFATTLLEADANAWGANPDPDLLTVRESRSVVHVETTPGRHVLHAETDVHVACGGCKHTPESTDIAPRFATLPLQVPVAGIEQQSTPLLPDRAAPSTTLPVRLPPPKTMALA